MKVIRVVLVILGLVGEAANGEDLARKAWELESRGDAAGARELLAKASENTSDAEAWRAYAGFLDRHREPEARAAYEKALIFLPREAKAERAVIARRLAALDLLASDRSAAGRDIGEYASASDTQAALPAPGPQKSEGAFIEIPGPLRSFARMAALSPDLAPEDLLPALSRNVVTNGYQALTSSEGLEQTEYMRLVVRYLSQARELDKIAGADKVIRIETCESAKTADILRVLGYRMRGGCGSDVVLETVNASRAFLTIDSGFPLADLEQSLRANRPFVYDYHPARIPVLYSADYWVSSKEKQGGDFMDVFLNDPALCRLYSAFAKMDPDVSKALRDNSGIVKLRAIAHVLDFYGGLFEIRNGKAVTPGGARTEKAWSDIVGAPADKPAQFFEKLASKDDGWMASMFDALLRVQGPALEYLTEPDRLKRFYAAVRGKVTSPGPARPVFRANTDMMLLTTRMQIGSDGKAFVPGSLETWKTLFIRHPHGKYDGKLTKSAQGWKDPDDLVEALFGLCRKSVDNEPLKMYMALTDIERLRTKPLQRATVERLLADYRTYGPQYPIFAGAPYIDDQTILVFLDTADNLTAIKDQGVRADAVGTYQALVSIWQILCRQGAIPADKSDAALKDVVKAFADVGNPREVFDAGTSGVRSLLATARVPKDESVQDAMFDLLAGTASTADAETHTQVIQDMIRVFEAQRLISLRTLFDLSDNLERVGKGEKLDAQLVTKLASRISENQLPRMAVTNAERSSLGYGYYAEKHIEFQRKLNLRAAIEHAGSDPAKLREIRGSLTPFLRDTLVGLNYIHYAPPGAQILHANPVFVRSHDFIGYMSNIQTWRPTEVFGTGWPANAGGRLVGSLSSLPYALAEAEQNFLIPKKEQALIWGDLVPQIIISSTVPRWWDVTPAQVHWVNLHMVHGESLVAESVFDPAARSKVIASLSQHAPPARVRRVEELINAGDARGAVDQVTPAELFTIARDCAADEADREPVAAEIRSIAKEYPEQANYRAIGVAFGTPKPTLSSSYNSELLNLRTFPTLMGYSSRIMAETWESSLLYYASLADDIHARPAELNVLIPEWTQQTVERIFATHLEDWPALLRSLRNVGDEVRQKARKQQAPLVGAE